MRLVANLFKSVEPQLNGRTLKGVGDYLPQVDALKTRARNTREWLEHVVRTSNFWDANFATRREAVAVDGYEGSHQLSHVFHGPIFTQQEAGFHEMHTLRFNAASYIVSADQDEVDLIHGPMALWPGDRLSREGITLQVMSVIDKSHALVEIVSTGVTGR